MNRYRIEYESKGPDGPQLQTFAAPSIATALIIADINLPGGSAEIWDGQKHLARICKQTGAQSTFWRVG